jgi:hypothetical protein
MVPLSIASLQTEGISKPHFVSVGKATATAPAAAKTTTNATHIATATVLAMILVGFDLNISKHKVLNLMWEGNEACRSSYL